MSERNAMHSQSGPFQWFMFMCGQKGCPVRRELFVEVRDLLAKDQRYRIGVATQAVMADGWLILPSVGGWTCPLCSDEMVDRTTDEYRRAVERSAAASLIIFTDGEGNDLKTLEVAA